jgi:hypothetical protein
MLPARRWSEGSESSEQPDSDFDDDAATRIAPKNIRFARREDETKLYSNDQRLSLLVQGMLEVGRNERTVPAFDPGPMRGPFSTIPDEIETIEEHDEHDKDEDTRELAARQEQYAQTRIEGLRGHRPSGIERIKPPPPPMLPAGLVHAQARSAMPEMFGKRPCVLLDPEEAEALQVQVRAANEIARTSPRPVRLAQEIDDAAALADTELASKPRKVARWVLAIWLFATVTATSYAAVRFMPGSAGADLVQNVVQEVSGRVLPLLGR